MHETFAAAPRDVSPRPDHSISCVRKKRVRAQGGIGSSYHRETITMVTGRHGMIDDRMDRSMFSFTTLGDAEADDIDYWLAKSPTERIEALEYMRRWIYGDDQVDARLQRVFTVVKLGED
jgi:hypothetical protein